MSNQKHFNRREFLGTAAVASTITVLPRRVLGGPGFVAPSDKINVALVGSGTQALRQLMGDWLPREDLHVASITDPNKDSDDYRDWSPHGLRDRIREFTKNPRWGSEKGIRAGREAGKEVVETYYSDIRGIADYKGVKTYADYREMLAEADDIDAVIDMTPEHLHGVVNIAAMKAGKHVIAHKSLANTLHEVRQTVKVAKETGVTTHLMAWANDPRFQRLKAFVNSGVIGQVKEVHNWTNRPIWPQGWMENPTEKMKVPRGLDWDLWLGPIPDRPYHLDYTHALFRGWYDFGSGCFGDMGNYSFWRVYRVLDPGPVLSVKAYAGTGAVIVGNQCQWRRSDVAFPSASTVHFKHADVDLFYYDGGMKPHIPSEYLKEGEELTREGVLYVGEFGSILGDYYGNDFKLIPENRMNALGGTIPALKKDEEVRGAVDEYVTAMKEGKQSRGSFINVEDLAEATCLAAISLRTGHRIDWDKKKFKITNLEEANKLLTREYRPGWEV